MDANLSCCVFSLPHHKENVDNARNQKLSPCATYLLQHIQFRRDCPRQRRLLLGHLHARGTRKCVTQNEKNAQRNGRERKRRCELWLFLSFVKRHDEAEIFETPRRFQPIND